MIDAVEPVAANAALKPFVGARIACRRQRHLAMKAGVEDSDLRDRAQKPFDDLHALEFGANVERGKRGSARDCRTYLRRPDHASREVGATMHHAPSPSA